jgi:hypothetical protein
LLTSLHSLGLYENKLTGTVPPLPFAQYTHGCVLNAASPINCNHFKCPLPKGNEVCKFPNGDPGVECGAVGTKCFH